MPLPRITVVQWEPCFALIVNTRGAMRGTLHVRTTATRLEALCPPTIAPTPPAGTSAAQVVAVLRTINPIVRAWHVKILDRGARVPRVSPRMA
jgi:hypothetical protein